MNKLFTLVLFILFFNQTEILAQSSQSKIIYTYDVNGNRIARMLFIEPLNVNKIKPDSSINNFLNSEEIVTVSPNPANQQVNIFINSSFSDAKINSIELYNASGLLINTINQINKEISINLTGYADGLYILKVATTSKNYTYKIIKQ